MSKSVNTEKIIKELDKSDIPQLKSAFFEIKEYVTKRLVEHQAKLSDEANETQLYINSINNGK